MEFSEREILQDAKDRIVFKLAILDLKEEIEEGGNPSWTVKDHKMMQLLLNEAYCTYERLDLLVYAIIILDAMADRVHSLQALLDYYDSYFTRLCNDTLRVKPTQVVPSYLTNIHQELECFLSEADNNVLFTRFLVEVVLVKPYPHNPYTRCCNLGFLEKTELNYLFFKFLLNQRDLKEVVQRILNYYNEFQYPFGRSFIAITQE